MSCLSVQTQILPLCEATPLWCGRRSSRRAAQRLCDAALVATAAAFARQSAMYLAHVSFGLSFSEIGRAFGRDRTTAAHACRLIEDRRDDPAVDAVLGQLESACCALRRRMNPAVQS